MLSIIKTVTLTLLSLGISLFLAWQTLSGVNFGYSSLYDWLNIEQTIQEFAPKNQYKQNFELTVKADHIQLFQDIVTAVNNQGKGLTEITYADSKLNKNTPLLHDAEVVHLQDVANLIDDLNQVTAYLVFIFVISLTLIYRFGEWQFPPLLYSLGGTLGACSFAALVVIVTGAEKLFYQWHVLVFPENHQWFFYYHESLMTTLMKAPDIFAYITVFLVLLTLFYHLIVLVLVELVLRHKTNIIQIK